VWFRFLGRLFFRDLMVMTLGHLADGYEVEAASEVNLHDLAFCESSICPDEDHEKKLKTFGSYWFVHSRLQICGPPHLLVLFQTGTTAGS
jgi:hypothetical protein